MSSSPSSLDDPEPIVIVLGSSNVQIGFAGSDSPRFVNPSVVGTTKRTVGPLIEGMDPGSNYCGYDAMRRLGVLDPSYLIERGAVKDWNKFEQLMNYSFKMLRISPEESSVLITESPLNPRENRERLCQFFFETYNVRRFSVEIDTILSMYSCGGRATGVLYCSSAVKRLDLGGIDVTEYLTRLLTQEGHYFRTSAEREIVRRLKESLAYVSYDFNQEMAKYWTSWRPEMDKYYELPDGHMILVTTQLFECTECLFQPLTHLGRDHIGIHQLIYNCIKDCQIDIRKDLYSNILLSGGNTLLSGFPERLRKEIMNLAPPKSTVKMSSPPERKYSTWIGGSVLASLSSFSNWVDKSQYDLVGPNIMSGRSFL
ncbi:Actin2.1 [Oopsacas minuta]|uniref:Actin2.1 n=1 Tax=Oopsacas minuta TaxID=111878 RepID=A0AAV7JZS4_9METZ|nr:Actin2.1 [Oopsacas minuta]